MADKVLSSRSTPYPYRVAYGTYQMRTFTESTCASTAAIRSGHVVQFDVNTGAASNKIVKSSTMANAPNVLSSAFLGIAMDTSTSAGSSASLGPLTVCLATPETEFWFPTKSSVVTSTCIGTRKALAFDSTLDIHYVDLANSTGGDATVVVTDVPEPGTDANNGIVVKFLSTATARLISRAF